MIVKVRYLDDFGNEKYTFAVETLLSCGMTISSYGQESFCEAGTRVGDRHRPVVYEAHAAADAFRFYGGTSLRPVWDWIRGPASIGTPRYGRDPVVYAADLHEATDLPGTADGPGAAAVVCTLTHWDTLLAANCRTEVHHGNSPVAG